MAYDIGPKIGIEGDKAFKNALKAVNSQIKETAEELKTLSIEYEGNFSSIEGASKKQEALANAMEATKSKISLVTEEYKRQKEELTRLGDALEEAKKNFGADSNEALKAQNAFNDQAAHVNNLATNLENAKGKLADYTNQMRELGDEAKRAGEQLQEVGEKVSDVGDKISNFGGGMEKAGGFLTKSVTLPVVGIGTAALKAGDDFEAGMSRVAAISRAGEGDLQRLTDMAIKLGANTKFSATEVSDAMYYMAMAGWRTGDILDGVSGVLDLAAAGNTDLATASDIVTDAMTAFRYEAKDCERFVNVLAAAATNSNTDIEKMGETFKYVGAAAGAAGYSVEAVGLAIGLMANQGIKSTQAGTAIRSIMTRIATDAGSSSKSLGALGIVTEELGVEFYNTDGTMRDFGDVLKDCRKSWKGLTKEEQANYAKKIAGQEAYTAWMALMNATDEEVENLDKSLNNANGTAKKMADTMMDNVKGSLEEAKGSLETAGIAVQKQLAPYVKDAAGFVKDLANEFSGLDEKQQKQIVNAGLMVAAAGPALKIGGKVVDGIGSAVKGVGNLITDIGKVKAAGGEAVDGVGGLAQVFGKLGPKGIIITTAVIGLAAIGTAIWAAHEQMIKADIDGHFGDIYLSAKEVEDVAKRLTTTEWSMKVSAVVDAKNELEDIQDTLDGYKKQIDKADWKVSVGLELTQGEIESYAGSVEGYVKEVQKYVEQHQYTVALAIDTTVGKDSTVGRSLETFAQSYYKEAQGQLTALGNNVAQILNDAIANGTLNEETMLVIKERLSQMSDIQQEIADMQYKGKLESLDIKLSAGGYGLDYDSFKRLSEEAGEEVKKIIEGSIESQSLALGFNVKRYEEMVEAGVPEEFAKRVYEDAKKAIEYETQQKQGEAIQIPLNIGFDTIKQNYGPEMSALSDEISKHNGEFFDAVRDSLKNGTDDIGLVINKYADSMPQATGSMKRVIEEFLKAMEPQKKQLEAIRDQYIAAGQAVPESIQKGLSDIYYWEAISGNLNGKASWLATQITNDPELFEELQKSGAYIPQELADAITANTGLVYDAATGIWQSAQSGAQEGAEEAAKILNEMAGKLPEGMAESIAEQYGLVKDAATGLWEVAQGELDNKSITARVKVSGDGMEDGLSELWKIGQGVLDQCGPMNVRLVPIGEGLEDGVSELWSIGQAALEACGPLWARGPEVDSTDMYNGTVDAYNSSQDFLDDYPLRASVEVVIDRVVDGIGAGFGLAGSILGFAQGGIVDTPQIAAIAEDGKKEAIIPLENNRARARSLWIEAGRQLQMFPGEAGRDRGYMAGAMREAYENNSYDERMVFEEGSVVINTQAADGGRLYEDVKRRLGAEVQRKKQAYGR